ncbi:aldehyde dehydrogenase family protein [Paraglaciecola chathamensis]|uniref:Aldehyde dehydrogenase, mitochondrial n=1 Tax=Paraglaciecola agarilytica NO2 TaxID=1125747 RepID=A0ABQ0I751_9ALTE|nr:aldehyde dehydrogenase family protein [Paraglaciecola agarilytica]GAC05125.1 aldehyde dehydrogenase, mitochondrial [Paraglaciecola agarilytica NO2]
MQSFPMLINGELVQGNRTLNVINPATEEVFQQITCADESQFEQAIAAAKGAFAQWQTVDMQTRRDSLNKLADALEAQTGVFAELLTQEQGKPLAESTAEVGFSCAFIRYFAQSELPIETYQDDETSKIELHRKPLGVVAGVVPWNFPLMIGCFKLAPAVLSGNTFILKPPATTPLCVLKLADICQQIFPKGVVNIITDNNDLGHILSAHPDVAKVAFTGSTPTGKKIMSAASGTLKRLTLELGGNDAGIVLPDVDPKKIAPAIFATAFMNCGQVCIALKRLYVHEDIYDDLVHELSELANSAVVGNGLHDGVTFGPIQNKAQFVKVQEYLADAKDNGVIAAGGEVLDGPGFFMRPTIVRDVTDGCKVVDEEPFGPILPVIKYKTIDDAVERANNSVFGLGGSVWSNDLDKAYEVAKRLECGTSWINQHLNFGPTVPFGGAKESGIGVEFAQEGLLEYTQVHVINIAKQTF